MKRLLILSFILGLFGTGFSQTIEQATTYYEQDSIQKAMLVIDELDQTDKEVKKLGRKLKRRQKQIQFEYQNRMRVAAEVRRAEAGA